MCDMPREHFSMRLSEDERGRLAERSRETNISESELARRYVSEGLRRDLHPAITMRPGRVGGRPALASRPRLEVAVIVETWQQNGRNVKAAAKYHELTEADIRSALAYYADFSEEIDEVIARKRRIAERYERVFRQASAGR